MSATIPITVRDDGELVMSECTCAGIAIEPEPCLPLVSVPAGPPQQAAEHTRNNSYGQILKSSALIGGSQVVNIAIGIVRTKAMAILLGPAGFGLFGLYGSIQNLTQSIAGMGINSIGVRQIAEAVGTGNHTRIAQTAAVLRRTCIIVGLLGAAILLAFSRPISKLTFGTAERSPAIALLSVAVFLALVSGGQGALIQGMRRIADLARMSILGALFGLCTSIPLVYFFRERGVVPSLISVAGMSILTSWWYSRKIKIEPTPVTLSQVRQETSALLKLGSAFMASALMTMGVAYFVRVIILLKIGFEATGLYQSAWTLGGLYVGFILQAMGADFYPRLTACAHDDAECNRLVNEQTLIGLLLAGPGVIATLTFAPLVLGLFYSAKFAAAVVVLRWICLGVMLQVITWPMGFVIIAKGRSGVFFAAELAWTIVAVALSWVCVSRFGLNGAGLAFFGSYVFHLVLLYPIAGWLTHFRWSAHNKLAGVPLLGAAALVFWSFHLLPFFSATVVGILVSIATTVYSLRLLLRLVALDRLPRSIQRLLR